MQALNVGIYRAIGHEGVYYGFKLGHNIPWHDGFPFNLVPHPQYVGSVLTVWGVVALVRAISTLATHTTLPKTEKRQQPLVAHYCILLCGVLYE